jgi:hypothetical protein
MSDSTAVDVGHLLYELCTKLGFCLSPDDTTQLVEDPPPDVDAFTDAVLRAEGFNPVLVDKGLRRSVWELVAQHFGSPAPTRSVGRKRRR